MTEAFHVLPLAGGLFDQPAGYITRMEAVLRAQNEHEMAQYNKQQAQEKVEARLKEQVE